MERNIAELESQIKEKEIKLNTYEQLEHELDDVVMQAAEGEKSYCLNELIMIDWAKWLL